MQGMESEEWGVGEWRVSSEQWRVGNGEWSVLVVCSAHRAVRDAFNLGELHAMNDVSRVCIGVRRLLSVCFWPRCGPLQGRRISRSVRTRFV